MDHGKTPEMHHNHKPISKSELLSSAKVVAGAVMGKGDKNQKMDKGKVAGAASDLLCAASQYGKLDEKSYGKYVSKAEDYLHNYSSKTNPAGADHHSAETGAAHAGTTTGHTDSGGGHGHSTGDYFKMAEGFLKK